MASTTDPKSPYRPGNDVAGPLAVSGDLIWTDPDRMHGEPCFRQTRVPVRFLFDYLKSGDSLDTFLADFPSVDRTTAIKLIEASSTNMIDGQRRE
jgi:uncharacterized protein (DUF433 family)